MTAAGLGGRELGFSSGNDADIGGSHATGAIAFTQRRVTILLSHAPFGEDFFSAFGSAFGVRAILGMPFGIAATGGKLSFGGGDGKICQFGIQADDGQITPWHAITRLHRDADDAAWFISSYVKHANRCGIRGDPSSDHRWVAVRIVLVCCMSAAGERKQGKGVANHG